MFKIAFTNTEFHSTQIVLDTSDVTDDELDVLTTAAATRLGFDAETVLTSAGLADKVLAGNYFNVTNPGPVAATNTTTTNSTTGGGGSGSTPSPSPISAATVSQRASGLLIGIMMVGVAFFAL